MKIVSRLCVLAVAVGCAGAGLGCRSWTNAIDTKMIAKNEFAQSQGMAQMKKDVDECGVHSVRERKRLRAQLWGEDTYLADQAAGRAASGAVGREIGQASVTPDSSAGPPKRRANGEIDKERVAGAAGAAAAGFVWRALTSDSSKHETEMLTMDIDSLRTYVRLKNTCLRGKGYEVPEHAEDGAGTAYLLSDPLRVMLHHEDGREVVMYERPKP